MKKNRSNQINPLTQWVWIILTLVLCSFTLLAYAAYGGTPYSEAPVNGEAMMIIQEHIDHAHHDDGGKYVAYYELTTQAGSPQSDSRAEKMAPSEWAKYTLNVPDRGYFFADVITIHASTPCTQDGKFGNLQFAFDGNPEFELNIPVDTDGRYNKETIHMKVVEHVDLNRDDDGNVVLKIKSTGNCGVYLEWFEFSDSAELSSLSFSRFRVPEIGFGIRPK